MIKAIKDYTICRGVDYQVYESEPTTFYAKCTQYDVGCDWLIKVSNMCKKYYWEIRRYNGSHTCTRATISQDHLKLDSNTIAEAIKALVEVDSSIKVKSVIAEVQSKFNYTISYHKGWLAKQKAVESIFCGWKASYEALSIWFEAMCHNESSAVVYFKTMPAYQGDDLVPNIRVLHRVFWSYYPCIRAFRHCKPIVQDGNNNIVPIAFAIVEGEISEAWHFFLNNLRQHVMTHDGVGLISNRHESINSAIARSLLFIIGYSRTVREYKMCYQRLREWGEAYTNWLNRIPREQYALAFDGGYRWGHMTTNLVECINSILKGARNLLVTALVKAMFYRLNELFTRKRVEAETHINARHVFSELVTSKLHANQRVSENIHVSLFDRQIEVFEVREMSSGVEYAVDLCRRQLDWQVYVHDVYKMDQVQRIYRARFRPLENLTMWPVYHGPRFVSNPFLRRVAKGRPKMTCFLNEMDTRMLRAPRRCKQCGVESHNHSKCRQRGCASADPATQ
ncbi:uncharacterized protein [Arachis hypogaea]|uniref:uncharacterized protein n=1 Tax=Arachis hypogaea TaxID=3818 RepID=UPI000DEC61D4|nr:uncharacterized protein LOC112772793 [Arachis hypogaea]